MVAVPLVTALLSLGCVLGFDDDGQSPFGASGTPAPGPASADATTTGSDRGAQDGSTDSGDASSDTEPLDDGAVSSSDGDGSPSDADGGPPTPAESTSGDDGTSTGSPSADDDGGTGPQPLSGMYAHCLDPQDCGAATPGCFTAQDETGTAIDGFCTDFCNDPRLDCDPNPGGTAVPACDDFAGEDLSVCVLNCNGGLTCPGGMVCLAFPDGSRCV